MTQLALKLALLDNFKFSSFHVLPENREIVDLLQIAFWSSLPQIFLAGVKGSGKSHLLQASCYRIQEQGLTAAYISLRQLAAYGVRVLEGLDERHAVLAVDDIDLVLGEPDWEAGLVHLINRCRQNQQGLILAARKDPHQLFCELPDLASRLIWGPTFNIVALNAEQALDVFQVRSRQRGLDISDTVLQHIAKRFPNQIQALMDVMERLDREHPHKSKKISRQLIQEIFPPEVA